MTREEFGTIVKGMKAVYAQEGFIADQDAFDTWYALLGRFPYKAVTMAAQAHMLSSRFPPTPADINAQISKLRSGNADSLPSAEAAWALVRKAAQNSGYHAEAEYAKLPPMTQRAVGTFQNLQAWALMEMDEFETVQKSHFVRAYRSLIEREKEEEKLPGSIRSVIDGARIPQIADGSATGAIRQGA